MGTCNFYDTCHFLGLELRNENSLVFAISDAITNSTTGMITQTEYISNPPRQGPSRMQKQFLHIFSYILAQNQ